MRIYQANDTDTATRVTALEQKQIRPEARLESWLHANPGLILGEPLLIIGRQVRLDTGVADLIACDQFGNVVICEVKIGRSGTGSASEETILSQPQNYAQSIQSYDYDDLNEFYQSYNSRLEDQEWKVDRATAPDGSLQSAFETVFGKELATSQFNSFQRMVVVAEEITRRTAANARYLLEQGLHFQCAEVQWFTLREEDTNKDDHAVLGNSIIVDYDTSRVRPKGRPNPTYPELAGEILERAFSDIQDLVETDSLEDVLPNGLDSREHRLVSNNPHHPQSVTYRLDVKPDQNTVLVGIDIRESDDEILNRIQANTDLFSQNGFKTTDNEIYRVVVTEWNLDELGDVQDLIDEVANHFARLVQLGHDLLVDHTNP